MRILRSVLLGALAATLGTAAYAQSAADRAVDAAKKHAGTEISIVWEAGLQALDPLNFSGPKWEQLTGIKVKVIEVPTSEMFTKILQEHRAGTGAYDALNVIPSWMPDLVRAGALVELDGYVDKNGYREELQTIAPTYRDNQMKVDGKIYGLPDDGDVFVLYYRKDLFEDPANRTAFKQQHGYDLAPPATWEQYAQIGKFFTDKYAPKIYGAGQFRQAAYGIWLFQERFRALGGKFFDPQTMRAQINSDAGIATLEGMRNDNKFMPPGVETWGFVEALSAFLAGDIAMTISWPPFGRWAAGYGTDEEALSWVPKTTIADKVGYALPPGGSPQLAAGFSLSVAAGSKKKEAAYLFIQWLNSEEISLQRVQLPFALRDPFRDSHFSSAEYRSRWKDAPAYLDTLRAGASAGLLDLSILQIDKYEEVLRQATTRMLSGEDVGTILDDSAAQWDALTDRIGLDRQRAAYEDWSSKPNAYPN